MIRITNLNKHFNKNSANAIHVINNTTLEFPRTGLVSITGPSGCGKTTLLNVLGGLDSFESGEINFDGQIIKKYRPLEWDVIRNNNIGYIFQNYSLIEDKTVYENIEISLNMAGLYEKEEIDNRINYVLEAVGLRNYRRRSVLALSGGQRQRVGIARALAKNPKVILADEPTGNLDANNTFEVMGIIKKISQNCLVILVSHEKTLVDFYSDRVIKISDGLVVDDYVNEGSKSIDRTDERDIYLKDLNKSNKEPNSNIERYYESDKDDTLSFTIVEVKNSIYIKADTLTKKKIKFITNDTEINLIDDHYQSKQAHEALDYDFDMHKYGKIENRESKKSFIRLKDSFIQGFNKVTRRRKFIGKLFLLVYFVISALVVYQLATFANLTKVEDEDFLYSSRDLVAVEFDNEVTTNDVEDLLDNVDGIELVPYQGSVYSRIYYSDFYQGNINVSFDGYPVKSSWVDETKLINGRMPETSYEIVIDKWIAEDLLKEKRFSDLGVKDVNELINSEIHTNTEAACWFTIVGIIDTDSPIMVVEDDAIYSFFNYFTIPYGSVYDQINIVSGDAIQDKTETLAPRDYGLSIGDPVNFGNTNLTVVGLYEYKEGYYKGYNENESNFIVSNEWFEPVVLDEAISALGFRDTTLLFYSNDMVKAIQDVNDHSDEVEAQSSYDGLREAAVLQNQQDVQQRVLSIVITLGGIVVYIFFMMRSSMLSRIKEIGTYRAIGATKRDIHKIFFGEIFWYTTIGSLPAYLLMSYLINEVQNMLGDLISVFYFPPLYFFGGIIGIYLINFIFGMLPIANLLRKTPSQINAKFDI